jgi:transcriptional regulator with XRE-family HTH domain/predicted Fe-Mo cluster-binding NifX family protein
MDTSFRNTPEVQVGRRLRELRTRRGFSLRSLADHSGLNINTLSLIENGKSSPSVGTLHLLALALDVPISAFFEAEPEEKRIVYTPAGERPSTAFGSMQMQNLGEDLAGSAVQPFVISLEPGKGSGERMIVHTGHEFVYCLSGTITYTIDGESYELNVGDSLVFEAHLPHRWQNEGSQTAQILLVLHPADEREEPGGRHFSIEFLKKELTMKIAVITEDGKSISQHFGRAPYYQVLTIEEGEIVQRELRDKLGHHQFSSLHTEEPHSGAEHGTDPASHDKHVRMAESIADCKVVLCGGMGRGAYESMRRLNITPVVTDLRDIDAAVAAFIDGKLIDHVDLLH